jgi:inner membrane protein involved in colicin E2 resistance
MNVNTNKYKDVKMYTVVNRLLKMFALFMLYCLIVYILILSKCSRIKFVQYDVTD